MINLRFGEQEGISSRIGYSGKKAIYFIVPCFACLVFTLSLWGGEPPARRIAVFGISAPEQYFYLPLSEVYAGVMARLDRKSESKQYQVIDSLKIKTDSTDTPAEDKANQGYPSSPEIPFAEAEYVIFGGVVDRAENLVIELNISSAGNGERIKTVISPYDMTRSGFENGFLAAGRFGSISRILKAFEMRKRIQNPRIAIGPQSGKHLLIHPQKTFANAGESFPVLLQLSDYDGIPLKARRLVLESTHGRFDRKIVMTGEDGKGEALYTTDDTSRAARIQVRFTYDFPWGHTSELTETAEIRIFPSSVLIIESELNSITRNGENYSQLDLHFKIQAELSADHIEAAQENGGSVLIEHFKLQNMEIKSYSGQLEYQEIQDGQTETGKCRVTDAFMDYYIDNLTVFRDPISGKAQMVIIPELNIEYLLSGTDRCEGDHPEYFTIKALEPCSAAEFEDIRRNLGGKAGPVFSKGRFYKDRLVCSGDGLKEWGGKGARDATQKEGQNSTQIHQKYIWKIKLKQ